MSPEIATIATATAFPVCQSGCSWQRLQYRMLRLQAILTNVIPEGSMLYSYYIS